MCSEPKENECVICGSLIHTDNGYRECPTCGFREWPNKPKGKPICEIICHADRRSKRCIAAINDSDITTVVASCAACEYGEVVLFGPGKIVREKGEKRLQPIIAYKE